MKGWRIAQIVLGIFLLLAIGTSYYANTRGYLVSPSILFMLVFGFVSYKAEKKYPGKYLKYLSVIVLALALFTYYLTNMPRYADEDTSGGSQQVQTYNLDALKVHELVNTKRVEAGIPALSYNDKLAQSALEKCNDMVAVDYFDHDDPRGKQSEHIIAGLIPEYNFMGENIAKGYTFNGELVAAWMGSETHRGNILDNDFTEEGIAVCHSDDIENTGSAYLVVQHFVSY